MSAHRLDRAPRRPPTTAGLVVVFAVVIALIVTIVWALAAGSRFAARALAGGVASPLLGWLVPFLIRPEIAAVLALGVLGLGLARANRHHRPGLFRLGIVALALAIATFWPMQYGVIRLTRDLPEARALLHLGALVVSLFILTGGIEAIRRAREDDP